MSYKTAAYATTVLAVFLMCSATARELPNENLQPTAAQGSNLRLTGDGPGRYRLTGRVVDSNNRPACGLALASGKCMFSCGPGSPRCEGGTANLPFGEFDLRDLPTEADGTIMLQTFVFGNLPGRQVLKT
ncbi:hypothetical protein RZS08_09215, partial [Arthrospira platensis SPKY1]|nr:hypothetical protein [Arthrospira platensis SPKY1]